jgi:hypothetical protein
VRYQTVVSDALDLVVADATITNVIPAAKIRKDGDADFAAPSMFWSLVTETPDAEVYKAALVQFDPFVTSQADLITVVDELERLFHRGRQWTLGSTRVRSQVLAIRDLPYRDGMFHGTVDVQFKAVRRPYS